jgi:PPK2 family polyphosphate:nucleotide phosphotransferase
MPKRRGDGPNGTRMLEPIDPGTAPALDDDEAAPPAWLPPADELAERTRALLVRAATLQQLLWAERSRALLFVLQGRDAAGKDGVVRKVFNVLHPAGLHLRSFGAPEGEELRHHFLWRVVAALPEFGSVGVWNRSHYEDILVPRVHGTLPRKVWRERYERINEFEEELAEARITLVKRFVHISRDEQATRFRERATEPTKRWKLQASDFRDRAKWDDFTRAYRDVIRKCSRNAPWYVVPADRKPVRDYLVAQLLVHHLERLDPQAPPADPELARQALAL